MNKDVIVTVGGLLFTNNGDGGEADNIEVISPGEYYIKNGKHYVMFEEIAEEFSEPVRNLLKISQDQVSIRKRGLINTEMVFEKGGSTVSHYSTPFGTLVLGIRARDLQVKEEEECIHVKVDYDLEINYEHMSDCSIQIKVQSKGEGGFSLTS